MSREYAPVQFFDPDITINVTETNEARFIGKRVSLSEFAPGCPVALYSADDGTLYAERRDFLNRTEAFISGPEA